METRTVGDLRVLAPDIDPRDLDDVDEPTDDDLVEAKVDGADWKGHQLVGARVSGSRIVGPVILGAGTVVENAYIGPFTSVSEDCRIEDSEIEYSIVLRGASIKGVRRIECSLIGREVEVTPAPRVPKAHRLVLGDHSKVQISS